MITVTIPDYFAPDAPPGLQLIDYRAEQETTKQQVNLAMNTFSFLREGHKEVISGGKSISISNERFLLMKAGKCLMTEKFAPVNHSYRSVLLFFPNDAVFAFARKHNISIHKDDQAHQRPVQAIAYDSFVQAFVENLVQAGIAPPPTRTKLLAVKFEELMLYLTDTIGPSFLSALMADTDNHSRHFLQVVENNKLNKLSLTELAFLSNMSLSTFKREFEKHFEESPSKWFQEQRLEHAALRLKNEAERPSDIYEDAGYDSLSNFIQAFKARFGVTPKQYPSA